MWAAGIGLFWKKEKKPRGKVEKRVKKERECCW